MIYPREVIIFLNALERRLGSRQKSFFNVNIDKMKFSCYGVLSVLHYLPFCEIRRDVIFSLCLSFCFSQAIYLMFVSLLRPS